MEQFSAEELKYLAGCCNRELKFLQEVESCGIPTPTQQAAVAALRSKCAELSANMQTAEAATKAEKQGPKELVK